MNLTPRELQKQAIACFMLIGLIVLIWYITLLINMKTQEPQRREDIKPGYYLMKSDLPPVACEVFDNDGTMTVCVGSKSSPLKDYDLTSVTFVRLVPESEKAAAFVQGWRVGSGDTPRTAHAKFECNQPGAHWTMEDCPASLTAKRERELTQVENLLQEKHENALALADKLAEANDTIAKLRQEIEKAYHEGWMTSLADWNTSRAKRVAGCEL